MILNIHQHHFVADKHDKLIWDHFCTLYNPRNPNDNEYVENIQMLAEHFATETWGALRTYSSSFFRTSWDDALSTIHGELAKDIERLLEFFLTMLGDESSFDFRHICAEFKSKNFNVKLERKLAAL